MGILDKLKDIEREREQTQVNKKTMYHLGRLKAREARLRSELLASTAAAGGGGGDGFEVRKSGDVRIAIVGFPSVGKSSFLSKVTTTESAVAAYEFTTLTCVPGKLVHKGTEIQLLDLPGIIEGASEGKGRGKQVIATARTADLILVMVDAGKAVGQLNKIFRELEAVGLRLNQQPPNITFRKKPPCSMNAINYTQTIPLKNGLDEGMVKAILQDYRIFNADVVIREDVSVDEFIDVVEGNRRYMPCVVAYNKIDQITLEETARLANLPNSVVCSVALDLNIMEVIDESWKAMKLIRIFTKKKGHPPDLAKPFVVKTGATIEHVCKRIHKDLVDRFKYAMVWGTSARHSPQVVGLSHVLEDEDVLQILVKTSNE